MQENESTQPKVDAREETVAELVHRHLMDPNHETTDEELRNIKFDSVDENLEEKAREKEAELTGSSNTDEDSSDKIIVPHDVIE